MLFYRGGMVGWDVERRRKGKEGREGVSNVKTYNTWLVT